MSFFNVSFLPVLVLAVINFLLGWLWYSPKVLGAIYAKDKTDIADMDKPNWLNYIGYFAVSLITAWVTSLFAEWIHLTSIAEGVTMGFFIWLGFIATTQFYAVICGGKSLQNYLIDVGYLLLGMIVMSSILSVWR